MSTQPIITLHNLSMQYGDKPVLRGIDLDVEPGHVLGYIGPNGAGKTTTVKILIGMLAGFTGQATVCGHDVAVEPLEVKRRIGYVPESAALYDALTPMEYLRFIGRLYGLSDIETQRRSHEMLDLFGLVSELDNRMSTFSKGMKQKVLIAAGMIHNPDVLFLDEPLSGLDANAVVTVKEIISRLARRGKTIFYCSHVMDVVERVCDRIVIVSGGRIIADGSFEQLQASDATASLEHIFTQLTGDGGHEAVADRFIETFDNGNTDARVPPSHG
jgi:ABC-2 type transport system ATP-binding protein